MRGTDPPTELLRTATRPGPKARNATAPHRWTAPAHLRPAGWSPAEAAGFPPLRPRGPGWRPESETRREEGTGTQPGGRPGPAQPGSHALRLQRPPLPLQPDALRQGSIRNPQPGPGEPPRLRPGQTGKETGSGTGRGTETGTVSELPGGAGPEAPEGGAGPDPGAQGGEVPPAGPAARHLHPAGGGAVARSPERERESDSMRG